MPDFAAALDINLGDIERPPLPPTGHYEWEVTNTTVDASGNGEWEIVGFSLAAKDADDDVDRDELAKAGGLNSVRLTHRFLFPTGDDDESEAARKRTLYSLKRFLNDHLGVPEGMKLKEGLEEAKGKHCIANVVHKQDKNDPDVYHANIGRTAPVV